ncbi:MAG: CHAT domain-containing protein [Sodalinema sp.]|uniref:CHAT domain-containing protein n=1 Tax=Sodalinema sp. TaxID=3080550 RepID=UPI00120345D4|nr:MAG: CHAT domain-containing protein [Phormidium sp. SL48-SHIP]
MTKAFKACILWLVLCLGSFWLTLKRPALSQTQEFRERPFLALENSQDRAVDPGLDHYQRGEYVQAIAEWETALDQTQNREHQRLLHRNLANAYQQLGSAPNIALFHWEQVLELAQADPNPDLHLSPLVQAQIQVEQAQLYDAMGQHQRAVNLLQEALIVLDGDRASELAALGALGNAYSALGRYQEAIVAHETSLSYAQALDQPQAIATALSNLANAHSFRARRARYQEEVARDEGEDAEAQRANAQFERDRQAVDRLLSQSLSLGEQVGGFSQIRSLLNAHRLLQEFFPDRQERLDNLRDTIEPLLSPLPASRDKIFALIYLAQQQPASHNHNAQSLLETAIEISRSIGDPRAESFALGTLGALYEQHQYYDIALSLSQQAQFTAQEISAFDSLYRWQWQAGRIYEQTNQPSLALDQYRAATQSLDNLRGDLITTSRDLQFEFRDAVEPVYRELIGLLLKSETPGDPQSKLKESLDILERLKLAELRNFFGDDCVEIAQAVVRDNGTLIDGTAVIIYSILLSDSTVLILQEADGTLTSYRITHGGQELQDEVDKFRDLLEKRGTNEYLRPAQRLYDWLVRPLEAKLEAIAPETLVFIQDGVLRKTPVAALHNGNQFLVESYALATTPSLRLTTTGSFNRRENKPLIAGLSVEIPPFSALKNVKEEVRIIQSLMGGLTLMDADFTVANLEQELTERSYSIVHLATHAKFGVDANSTFLLAFDDRITIEAMDQLLRSRRRSGNSLQPLELLVLSACQTAAGDNRSALGIAGVAVRAGAKTALASLWFINDEATVSLIESFYQELQKPGMTKAQALQAAQKKAIDSLAYNHPGVWSPFILIGTWR